MVCKSSGRCYAAGDAASAASLPNIVSPRSTKSLTLLRSSHGSLVPFRMRQVRIQSESIRTHRSWRRLFNPDYSLPRLQKTLRRCHPTQDPARSQSQVLAKRFDPTHPQNPTRVGCTARVRNDLESIAHARRQTFQVAAVQNPVPHFIRPQSPGMERAWPLSTLWSVPRSQCPAVSNVGVSDCGLRIADWGLARSASFNSSPIRNPQSAINSPHCQFSALVIKRHSSCTSNRVIIRLQRCSC